jgi:hypothetical protein
MSAQTDSIRLAILSAGASLVLDRAPLDATVAPVAQGQGYDVSGAVVGRVLLGMRRGSPGRVVDIKITAFDASATHTATIAGTGVAYSGSPADIPALCTAWASLITNNATVGAAGSSVKTTAQAVASTSGGAVDTVRITGSDRTSWTFAASFSGTATATVYLDPEAATLTVYEALADVASLTTQVSDAWQSDTLRAWSIMQGLGGDAVLTIADGVNRAVSIVSAGATRVRPHLTGVAGVSGDGTTGSGATVVLRTPVVAVVYGR